MNMQVEAVIWYDPIEQEYVFSSISDFRYQVNHGKASPEDVLYQFDQHTTRVGLKLLIELRCARALAKVA